MPETQSNNITAKLVQYAMFVITLIAFTIVAPIWIEARIDENVARETAERKEADRAIEERRQQQITRIEKKLDTIEAYIRDNPR